MDQLDFAEMQIGITNLMKKFQKQNLKKRNNPKNSKEGERGDLSPVFVKN